MESDMKLFIDTANVEHIREIASWGILSGVTTNPSLIAKEGRRFEDVIKEITELVDGPISGEVNSMDAKGMIEEGKAIAKIHPNMIVKIPMNVEGLKAVKELTKLGIRTNVTLVFSVSQALLAATVGATYVSPFVGRLDDAGHDGIELIRQIREVFDIYGFATEIISASIRHPLHLRDSALAGAHIATVPYAVFKQAIQHPLTDKGIAAFIADYERSKKNIK
jgi:transaldolase